CTAVPPQENPLFPPPPPRNPPCGSVRPISAPGASGQNPSNGSQQVAKSVSLRFRRHSIQLPLGVRHPHTSGRRPGSFHPGTERSSVPVCPFPREKQWVDGTLRLKCGRVRPPSSSLAPGLAVCVGMVSRPHWVPR